MHTVRRKVTKHHDLSREQAIEQTNDLIAQGWDVHFKFTCESCGERCTLKDVNSLYEYGECFSCGHETKLDRVGYLLVKSFI